MTNSPKISIIMASYNYSQYISEAIESVINQAYNSWELIVVDDGSKDNSIDIIQEYCKQDSRIKLYYHKGYKNKGLSKTIQLGISKTSYDWIAFLESDDVFEPNYLETKVKIIYDNPNVNFIFNNYRAIGDVSFENKSYHKFFQNNMKNKVGLHDYKKYFYRINPVPTFSIVMLKKELLQNLNFNSPIKPNLDWFLWGQIANKTEFYYTDKILTCWRKHPTSYINRTKPKITPLFFIKLGFYLPAIYQHKYHRFLAVLRMALS